MIYGTITLRGLEAIYQQMGLPEPFVWVHADPAIQGLITGYIHEAEKLCYVEHMIVLPHAARKFHTMMTMSREATRACHARGLDVVLKILHSDPRTGLRAWAKRQNYVPYLLDHEAEWFINRKESSDG